MYIHNKKPFKNY